MFLLCVVVICVSIVVAICFAICLLYGLLYLTKHTYKSGSGYSKFGTDRAVRGNQYGMSFTNVNAHG